VKPPSLDSERGEPYHRTSIRPWSSCGLKTAGKQGI
jgi:hypothetical protein